MKKWGLQGLLILSDIKLSLMNLKEGNINILGYRSVSCYCIQNTLRRIRNDTLTKGSRIFTVRHVSVKTRDNLSLNCLKLTVPSQCQLL